MKCFSAMALFVVATFLFVGAVAQADVVAGVDYRLGEDDSDAADGVVGNTTTTNIGVTPNTNLTKFITSGTGPTYTSDVAASAAFSVGSTLAMNFNGLGYYKVDETPCNNINHQAIEGWFKVSNTSQQALAYTGSSWTDGLGLYIINNHLQAIAANGFGLLDSGFTPTAGQWFYAAVSADNGTSSVYVNSTTAAATVTGGMANTLTNQFIIGAAGDATHGYSDLLTGAADHVRLLAFDGSSYVFNASTDLSYRAVPEPSTIAMLAAGLLGLLAYAWRKRK
jgi:hypothetical protein